MINNIKDPIKLKELGNKYYSEKNYKYKIIKLIEMH